MTTQPDSAETRDIPSPDALLPCPSGHDEAKVVRDYLFHVECQHLGCHWTVRNYLSAELAIENWNTRTAPAPPSATTAREGSTKGETMNALPSRFAIGDRVQFQLYENDATGLPGEVVRVAFDDGKVLYDLAMIINGEPYDVYPVRSVDSCFVQQPT